MKEKNLEIEKACDFMKMKLLKKMIEEGLEMPELPTFIVKLESDSSSTATNRKYFVCVFNISLWGGGNIFLKEL